MAARCRRRHRRGTPVDRRDERAELQRTFRASSPASIEVDGLNRLVLLAGLTGRQVEMLRAYSRYLRQIGFPFSQQYIEATLCRHAAISACSIGLFESRFDPTQVDAEQEEHACAPSGVAEALDAVPTLDDDRTLRAVLALIDATVRTNVFRPAVEAAHGRCWRSSSTRAGSRPPRTTTEVRDLGVLATRRGCPSASRDDRPRRLRWSDRREDFRTEILGLVKAQTVKNAVIVPTGAKGGFVVKQPPVDAEGLRAEGVACYREFISGLLDLTDNIVGGAIVPPPDTVRHDGDDPYLVVAADKGTATFSDIANEIAGEYGFWLGTRSRRAAAQATTTRRWASRPGARGRACADTPARSARTPTATS